MKIELDSYIREHLAYDPTSPTGLRWAKTPPRSNIKAGTPAFTSENRGGYFHGRCQSKGLKAHRVVFFLVHGEWTRQVDHMNGDRKDNRIENLRPVTTAENAHNQVRRGYWLDARRGNYRAYIRCDNKQIYLGMFKTEEEARAAHLAAKRKLHPTAPDRCFV